MAIHYAQCWEDSRTLCDALAVTLDDDVVSIASGGDNTFALLPAGPRSLTAVDYNPEQLSLLRLKLRAIERLTYDEFVGFLGAAPYADRLALYQRLRGELDGPDRAYWDQRGDALARGVIHCGKFERYFGYFRRFVLPLVQSRRSVEQLLAQRSLPAQREYYDRVWNSRRWRLLFRLFFSKFLLARLGRSRAHFRYVSERDIADVLLARTKRGLIETPVLNNYFVHYILTGAYADLNAAHPYLRRANFQVLRENASRIRLVQSSLLDYLTTLPEGSVSAFNLSDVFEYLSTGVVEETLREIARVGRPGARVAFWTLFIPRAVPASLASMFVPDTARAQELLLRDRTFFYGDFNLWRIQGGSCRDRSYLLSTATLLTLE